MTDVEQKIESLLDLLKADGRSAPEGIFWHQFWKFLAANKTPSIGEPPVPLILAASGASNRTKHDRLRAQMIWASRAGVLDQAIAELRAIPTNGRNRGDLETWGQDSFY